VRWIVSRDRRGVDFELDRGGDRAKDLVRNRERAARLQIPEYRALDLGRGEQEADRLRGEPRRSRARACRRRRLRFSRANVSQRARVVAARARRP
jgi:hypothetical protein